jgi:hypothetical protein
MNEKPQVVNETYQLSLAFFTGNEFNWDQMEIKANAGGFITSLRMGSKHHQKMH